MFKTKFLPAYLLTFVNVLGFSILIPVLPFVVEQYGAPKYVYGMLLSFYSFFQFIGAPYLGKLSDKKGRKPILLFSQFGTLLSWCIFASAYFIPSDITFIYALPIWVIAFSRILDGITGGNISVANAYISDITTIKEKKQIFGYLGGISGIAIVVGPGIGGYMASGTLGYLGAILIALFISFITLFIIQFYLKESLNTNLALKHKDDDLNLLDSLDENKEDDLLDQIDFEEKKKNSLLKKLSITARVRDLNPSSLIKNVFILRAIMSITMASYIGSIVLFVIDLFKFDEKDMGIFMLVVGIFLSFNQAFLYKKIVVKIGEIKTLALGFLLMVLGLIAITLTDDLTIYVMFYFFLNLGMALCFPVFNSIISQKVSADKQGEAMGISEAINSLCNAIFPVIAASLYSIMSYDFYYILAIIPFIGLGVCYNMIRTKNY